MARTTNNAVTVTTSATLLCDGNPNRTVLTFGNSGAVDVVIGNASVTTTAYVFYLYAGEVLYLTQDEFDVAPQGKWYGRTASSSAVVSVGEVTS